jgi:peroxiredoxin
MKGRKLAILILVEIGIGIILINGSACNFREDHPTTATSTSSSAKIGTHLGDIAPDFQLSKMDGSQVSLASLRGQPAVLIFWTAWCPVCKEEAPQFNQLAAKYESRGVGVLGINIQDSQARTENGIRDFGIRYSVARDGDAGVARRYNVTGTPTIVFVDRTGVVRYFGNQLPNDYGSRLETMLSDSGKL